MRIVVVGASTGLGRAFLEGLGGPGDELIGVSRRVPDPLPERAGATVRWISADLAEPAAAAEALANELAEPIDVLVMNVGLWEPAAFTEDYDFLADDPATLARMIDVNLTATTLVLQRLLPRVLESARPQILLTGSTSALPGNGRPEVVFGATKHALTGIAEALREGSRAERLAVTVLQLGDLNTEDRLAEPREDAAVRGAGTLIPVHDVVTMVRALLSLSDASYVRSLVLPAIADPRF